MFKEFILKYKNKLNTLAKILVIALPFLVLAYFGIKIYDASKYHADYSIDFSKNNFQNTKLPLYINENASTSKIYQTRQVGGSTAADIAYTPISFVFQPTEFSLKKSITFSATLKSVGDWEISLVCPECDPADQFNWQPFYYGWLTNYHEIAQFGTTTIYSKSKTNFKTATNTQDWISKNITSSNSVQILDQAIPQSLLANKNVGYIASSTTVINKTFRGPHDLYVYLQKDLDLTLIKKDMNAYVGPDAVSVNLYDLDDNLIYSSFLPDDGITTVSKDFAPAVHKEFKFKLPQPGIYRLSLQEADKNYSNADWTITYLKINTNKIIFSNQKPALFLQPVNLYTQINQPTDLTVNIWWSGQIQTTKINSKQYSTTINATADSFNKNIITTLIPGNYEISFKGNEKIGGAFFALDPKNYFEIYSNPTVSEDSQADVVFSGLNYKKDIDGWTEVSKTFSPSDFLKITDSKNINFSIRNTNLNNQFIASDNLTEKGLLPLSNYNNLVLFGSQPIKNSNNKFSNQIDWLKSIIPTGSILKISDNVPLNPSDLTNASNNSIIIANATSTDYNYGVLEEDDIGTTSLKQIQINAR